MPTPVIDPLKFAKKFWPHVQFYDRQAEVIYSVADNDETFCVAGNMLGKDFVAGFIVLWFFMSRTPCRVVTTSADHSQLSAVLWGEIRRWIQTCAYPLSTEKGGPLLVNDLHLRKTGADGNICPLSYVIGRVAKKGEGMLGHHISKMGDGIPRTLYVGDEACHDDQTEVLTDRGWMYFKDLTGDERLLTCDPITREVLYQHPTHLYRTKYSGPMYCLDRRSSNFMVTPNHRMLWKNSRGRYVLEEISNLTGVRMVPRMFRWSGEVQPFFFLPEVAGPRKFWACRKLEMGDWCEFLGWYLSEGNLIFHRGEPVGLRISQKTGPELDEISQVCSRLLFRSKTWSDGQSGHVGISDRGLATYLMALGRYQHEHHCPEFLQWLQPHYIERFLDAYKKGGGYDRTAGREVIYTSSKRMADDLQILSFKAGREATVQKRRLVGRPAPNGITRHDGYVVSRRSAMDQHFKVSRDRVKIVDYSGEVFCAKVPLFHTLFTRRNGTCMWSGNSGIEDESYERADTWADRKLIIGNPYSTNNFFYRGVKGGDILAKS